MEAKELRIGNYILDYEAEPEVSIYWKVEEIQRLSNDKALNQTLGVTYRKGSCWTCDPEPIPLTEEWLVKFGWGKSNEHELCDNSNDIVFVYDWHFKRFEIQIDTEHVGVEYRLYHIKYVHKLQNLYFALTNEELTIKQ